MPLKKKIAIIIGILVVLLLGAGIVLRLRFPMINDITTNPKDPPAFFVEAGTSGMDPAQMSYPPDFEPQQRKAYPYLAPMSFSMAPEELFARALQTARDEMGWEIVGVDEESLRFQAIAVTPRLKFKDDVVVVVSGIPEQATLNIRSRSRVGKSDLGANNARIEAFLKALRN